MRKVIFSLLFLVLFSRGVAMAALVDNGDTVTDTTTGLMWQKATAPGTYTWQQALAYAETSTLAGYTDWRLPNRNELQSLVDYSRVNPSIDPLLVPDTVSSYYWSSTTHGVYTYYAWLVSFYNGYIYVGPGYKSSSYYVRAVRAGQSGLLGNLVINAQPDAMNAAAPWILTGPNSYSQSGTGDQTLSSLPIGDYTIVWGDVSGWIKPSPVTETKALTSGGTITFSGTYVQQTIPVIQVTQSVLNFGYVPPGSYKDLILEVRNIGGGILTGTVSACPPFSILSGGNYSVGAGESQQVFVRYTAPLEEGSQKCSFVFTGGGGITVQVKGTNQKAGLPWLLLLLGN